eukprot:TRINITY_DN4709_c0_g2_i1.p1 TRINITY_DN4709_c0_g2~~TRINITY_DN4709_c0_g2_i1.p1  ORF type:complete len:776 (+),score=77.97 TRINITY_DN4709_c0_g2_i1:1054-3381(+)
MRISPMMNLQGIQYNWTISGLNYEVLQSLGINSRFLQIPPNTLRRDQRYQAELRIRKDDSFGSASLLLELNMPPSFGDFKVAPNEGIELADVFNLQTRDWQDDDLPMVFLFGAQTSSFVLPLTTFQSARAVNVRLPAGDVSNASSLEVFVRIRDVFLGETRTAQAVICRRALSLKQVLSIVNATNRTDEEVIAQTTVVAQMIAEKAFGSLDLNDMFRVLLRDLERLSQKLSEEFDERWPLTFSSLLLSSTGISMEALMSLSRLNQITNTQMRRRSVTFATRRSSSSTAIAFNSTENAVEVRLSALGINGNCSNISYLSEVAELVALVQQLVEDCIARANFLDFPITYDGRLFFIYVIRSKKSQIGGRTISYRPEGPILQLPVPEDSEPGSSVILFQSVLWFQNPLSCDQNDTQKSFKLTFSMMYEKTKKAVTMKSGPGSTPVFGVFITKKKKECLRQGASCVAKAIQYQNGDFFECSCSDSSDFSVLGGLSLYLQSSNLQKLAQWKSALRWKVLQKPIFIGMATFLILSIFYLDHLRIQDYYERYRMRKRKADNSLVRHILKLKKNRQEVTCILSMSSFVWLWVKLYIRELPILKPIKVHAIRLSRLQRGFILLAKLSITSAISAIFRQGIEVKFTGFIYFFATLVPSIPTMLFGTITTFLFRESSGIVSNKSRRTRIRNFSGYILVIAGILGGNFATLVISINATNEDTVNSWALLFIMSLGQNLIVIPAFTTLIYSLVLYSLLLKGLSQNGLNRMSTLIINQIDENLIKFLSR